MTSGYGHNSVLIKHAFMVFCQCTVAYTMIHSFPALNHCSFRAHWLKCPLKVILSNPSVPLKASSSNPSAPSKGSSSNHRVPLNASSSNPNVPSSASSSNHNVPSEDFECLLSYYFLTDEQSTFLHSVQCISLITARHPAISGQNVSKALSSAKALLGAVCQSLDWIMWNLTQPPPILCLR